MAHEGLLTMLRLLRPRRIVLAFAAALSLVAAMTPQSATAQVDVYTTPGKHTVNGRAWSTKCEKYSSAIERCRAEIWATQVVRKGSGYRQVTGWTFNNLTYKPQKRAVWGSNPLAAPGLHHLGGRTWRVECDTPTVGRNGCRTYLWGQIVGAKGSSYSTANGWVFNNLIRFTDGPPPGAGSYTGWTTVDAVIESRRDLDRLSSLPPGFKAWVRDFLARNPSGPDDCEASVTVARIHGAGYVAGEVTYPACHGRPTIFGISDGKWGPLIVMASAVTNCANLDAAGVPRGLGQACGDGGTW